MRANECELGLNLVFSLIKRRGLQVPENLRKTAYSMAAEIGMDLKKDALEMVFKIIGLLHC